MGVSTEPNVLANYREAPEPFYEEYTCDQLDAIALSGALYRLMARHEALRSTCDSSGNVQVHHDLPVPLSYHCLRGQPESQWRQRVAASRGECRRACGPAQPAPFAVRVFTLDTTTIVQLEGFLPAVGKRATERFAALLRGLIAAQVIGH